MLTDTGYGVQDIFGLKLGIKSLDLTVELGSRCYMGVYNVYFDGDFSLQFGEVDVIAVEATSRAGCLAQSFNERIRRDRRRGDCRWHAWQ